MKPELSELLLQNLRWWNPSLTFCIEISKQLGFTWTVLNPFGKPSCILYIGSSMCSYIFYFWAMNTFFPLYGTTLKPKIAASELCHFWDFISVMGGMAGELRTMDSYMSYPVFRRAWEFGICQLSVFIWSPAHCHLVPSFITLLVLGS